MKILNVVGARPNLMKIAPIVVQLNTQPDLTQTLLHTGQHYDEKMSAIFFKQLGLPQPDIYLGVGSGSHAQQTARVMVEFEQVLLSNKPDVVVVVGDVNSTLACAITAAKLWVPVAHVEAGLRSFDRKMPEEINRIVTDSLSDLLFTTSPDAEVNLRREGVDPAKIHFVGNVMIDTLLQHRAAAELLGTPQKFGQTPGNYALLTLHRPSNVDDRAIFSGILKAVEEIQRELPILFPAHPRTVNRITEFGLSEQVKAMRNLILVEPQGYLEFLDLMMHAKLMLTDSGGVQEETTILDVPCLTLRENTERPVTISHGTNQLVGSDPEKITAAVRSVLLQSHRVNQKPKLWDGHAAERIVTILKDTLA
jgi:UDP-N-acetylglucosamine 2-epimerase (non-hydrolysing)